MNEDGLAPSAWPQRLAHVDAIDALRGFALIFSCISVPMVEALYTLPPSATQDLLIRHLSHAEWHGCTFIDLGFQAYIMMLAMSTTFSFRNRRARGQTTGELIRHLIVRSLLLFAFATIYHGGFSTPLSEMRFTRIFHRLAIVVFVSGIIDLTTRPRSQMALLIAVLVGYWMLMQVTASPGFEPGDYSPKGNINSYVDKDLLGARTFFILSTFGVIGTCTLGVLFGHLLQADYNAEIKALHLLLASVLLINLGLAWDIVCPINKHIWTPSYVLYSAGWTLLIFLVFYVPTEVLGHKKWVFPLIVLGKNPLFAFAAPGLLPLDRYAGMLVGDGLAPLFGMAHPFVLVFTQFGLLWLLVYWLHRKNLIIRI